MTYHYTDLGSDASSVRNFYKQISKFSLSVLHKQFFFSKLDDCGVFVTSTNRSICFSLSHVTRSLPLIKKQVFLSVMLIVKEFALAFWVNRVLVIDALGKFGEHSRS